MATGFAVSVSFGIAISLILFVKCISKTRQLPGPKGLPILGSFLELPREFEWLYWSQYKDLYGMFCSTTILGQTIVVLNDIESCSNLLEKRSAIYSGRPKMRFAGEIVGWDKQLLLAPYGDHFRAMRKLAHRHLGTKAAAATYSDTQELQSRHLIARLQDHPGDVVKNIRITIGAILLRMSHGYITRTDGNDPMINRIEIAAKDFYDATKPGRWMVDVFPWLKHLPKWLPGAGFQKIGARYYKTNMEQTDLPYNFVLEEMKNGTALASFTSTALQDPLLTDAEQQALKYCAAALYGGGLDTMTGAITTFFLVMILFPGIQEKVHQELDRVVGNDRFPTLKDQSNLPFVCAVQKEIYRWRTIVPLGIPHALTKDDEINGCIVSKGSIVISNLWQIAHDESSYHDPMTFNPGRFLQDSPELDPSSYVFGFGRRKCPGIEVAHSTVFMIMTTCLAVFEIEPGYNKEGVKEFPKDEFVPGSVCHPKPFECNVRPRSAKALQLIKMAQMEMGDTGID
ncbi:cytochrome P450 [Lentinula detonsa]|uniref:Cytochrome P450 n=1 Tax=Lentinula detonsa TaxID=2804962 RepID=A0A9W8NWK7_9AGAR|nr:cytochrome P450 [Lentinula detonsa]